MPLRQVIGFIPAIGMIGGGLYLIIASISSDHLSGWVFLSAGFLVAIGAGWLWSDYLNPETRAGRSE
jgi:hypothetical protein